MPAPHYPSRRGQESHAWASGPRNRAPRSHNDTDRLSVGDGESLSRQALEAEVERLRYELACARQQNPGSVFAFAPTPVQMVWVALAICGAALLFTIMAVWLKG
jgi:hypothetical protein